MFHGEVCHVSSLAVSYGVEVNDPIFHTAHISVFYGACEDGRCPSLHTLCRNYLQLELEKTSPQAILGQRPLSAHMIRCAAIEVSALVPLQHAMVAEWQERALL